MASISTELGKLSRVVSDPSGFYEDVMNASGEAFVAFICIIMHAKHMYWIGYSS